MLSKLYITSNSTPEKLRVAHELASEAVDNKIGTDAASRNALNKLHLSLSKATGEAGSVKQSIEGETSSGTAQEVHMGVEADQPEAPGVISGEETQNADEMKIEIHEDEETKMGDRQMEDVAEANDSLLEELLDDDNEDL